jgi:glycosyltransferase involved in cell wall biosynthesis
MAFISIASELAKSGDKVTLVGSGHSDPKAPYRFLRAVSVPRERFESFPFVPVLRHECAYEELTFVPDLLRQYRPEEYDVTLTCSYPFTNWVLRRAAFRGSRPPHVFVTENGDWPATAGNSEFRFFGCEGLVCINPDFYNRNKDRWRCRLIPNGVNIDLFRPGPSERQAFGLPPDRLIVLMVSALVSSKRVERGIEAVSLVPNAHLVVAGDGPLRQTIDETAAKLLPNRFTRLSVDREGMPAVYRSANVFLHLSIDEPFGNVFVEAMACGLPVVAPDSSRLRWIVGDDEFLLNDDSSVAIASHIQMASTSNLVQQRRRETKAAAFAWVKIGAMYQDFLQEVITSSGRGL